MASSQTPEAPHENSGAAVASPRSSDSEIRTRAQFLVYEGIRLLKQHRKKLSDDVQWDISDQIRSLSDRLAGADQENDFGTIDAEAERLDRTLDKYLARRRKGNTRELIETVALALMIALFIRAFLFEPFKIPTGSMIPTLLVGDHIFVGKFIYGVKVPFTEKKLFNWREPKRGEVIVFEYPGPGKDHGKDFIKRVVAVPGDTVRLDNNVLYINGEVAGPSSVLARSNPCMLPPGEQCRWRTRQSRMGHLAKRELGCPCVFLEERSDRYTWVVQHVAPMANCSCVAPGEVQPQEVLNKGDWPMGEGNGSGYLAGWGSSKRRKWVRKGNNGQLEMAVPKDFVFVMGDNRDNSHDGRYWGLVPVQNIRGKALLIWWARVDFWGRLLRTVHG